MTENPENGGNPAALASDNMEIALSEWMMKRKRLTKKWKRTWFVLKGSHLSYGKSEQGPFKIIPLQHTVIEEAQIEGMKYVFRLRPPKMKRDFLIQAPNEQSEQRWMQAVCFAKVGANSSDASQACCIQ